MKKLLLVPVGLAVIVAAFMFAGSTAAIHPQPTQSSSNVACSITGTGVLSAAQVAAVASAAGFSNSITDPGTGKPVLVVAVALTKPESGANSQSVQNGGPIGGPLIGVGLWQITPGTEADLDPATNAKDAYAKWVGAHGFGPWTTYPNSVTAQDWTWAQQGVSGMATASGVSCQQKTTYIAGPAGNVNQVTPIATPAGLAQLQSYKGFPSGQCTFAAAWLYDQAGGNVTWHGNAAEWWGNAPVSLHTQTPAAGDIIVYGAGGGYSGYGHVGFIVAVNGTNLDVEEMNYLNVNQMDYRWDTTQPSLQARDILGFLHP